MKHFECQQVLNEALSKYAKKKKLDVAYPNIKYEPKVGTPWLKLFYLPTLSENQSFGRNHSQIKGIMQVDIFVPYDSGTEKAYGMAEDLQDIFATNSSVVGKKGSVRITDFDITNMQEDNWFRVMCEIHYTSFN